MDKPVWPPKGEEGPSATPGVPGSGTYKEFAVTFDHLQSKNAEYNRQIASAKSAAPTSYRVLILGETGTGKNFLAQAIHNASARKWSGFHEVLLPSFHENLAAAALFGVEPGAFTGAEKKVGAFKEAHKGTLFIDEVTEVSTEIQKKLLRVTQDGVITPAGGSDLRVDVRIITATNKTIRWISQHPDLFRADLFNRLAQVRVSLPPLRHRQEDIADLWDAFVRGAAQEQNRKAPGYGKDVVELLRQYPWPGNLRELRDTARSVLLCTGSIITADSVRERLVAHDEEGSEVAAPSPHSWPSLRFDDVVRDLLRHVLERSGGNVSEAARILDKPTSTVYDLCKKHGLLPERNT